MVYPHEVLETIIKNPDIDFVGSREVTAREMREVFCDGGVVHRQYFFAALTHERYSTRALNRALHLIGPEYPTRATRRVFSYSRNSSPTLGKYLYIGETRFRTSLTPEDVKAFMPRSSPQCNRAYVQVISCFVFPTVALAQERYGLEKLTLQHITETIRAP